MKLVFIENNRPVTDSLTVAETFSKEHKHVMRDIRELECSEEFHRSNFGLVDYVDAGGRTYQKFVITQDGFSFLVMGYTGKEAARFKEMYINEFNRMKAFLSNPTEIERFLLNPDTIIKIAENWKAEQTLRIAAEARIEADRPKVVFAESLEVSRDSILVADLSKILRQNGVMIGERRLFVWLRDNGYLIKGGSEYNMPTQRSMEMGLFEIRVGSRMGSGGESKITRTPKVTGKGQIYFVNKFKSQTA